MAAKNMLQRWELSLGYKFPFYNPDGFKFFTCEITCQESLFYT